MLINPEYYRAFYYVAIYNSISRAAEEMFISQPAVSKAIHNLEEKLKCTLFIRSSQGSRLTREGAVLFEHVSRAFEELEDGERKVKRDYSDIIQTISIGVTESPLYLILMPKLMLFRQTHSNVRFHISSCTSPHLLQMLNRGTVDLAMGVTPIAEAVTFPITELDALQDIFFAHKDFPIDDTEPLDIAAIAHCPIVGVGPNSSAGQHIAAFFSANGQRYEPMITVETSTQIPHFVQSRLAIGVAPSWTLDPRFAGNSLRQLNTSFSIPARSVFMAINGKYPVTRICQEFIDFIRQ